MSKTIPIAIQTEADSGSMHLGFLLRMQRDDGLVVGLTSAEDGVTIAGQRYQYTGGLDATSIVTRSGLAVDGTEMSTLNDGSIFVPNDVYAGYWRNAKFMLSRYLVENPNGGMEPIIGGTIGDARIQDDMVVCELLAITQYLQQLTISEVTSKTCRYELGDDRCAKDLTAFTFADVAVTAAGQQAFTMAALTQDDDYFGNGVFAWQTGNNAGLRVRIKSFAAGVVTLMLPMFFPVQNGDTATLIAGCRKRHDRWIGNLSGVSDCLDKFDNVLNFGGEERLPGLDKITKTP